MALGSTRPLTEMSTRLFPGGKSGRWVRLTTLPPSCAVVVKSGNIKFLEHSGLLQACKGTALPIQGESGGRVSILRGDNIGNCEKEKRFIRERRHRDIELFETPNTKTL